MTGLSQEQRAEIIAALLKARWTDGGHDGFPTKRTAEMLADQAVIPLLEDAEAEQNALRANANAALTVLNGEIERLTAERDALQAQRHAALKSLSSPHASLRRIADARRALTGSEAS